MNADSFQYALENTHVLRAPETRLETFGDMNFRFYVLTETMDRVNEVRLRNGSLQAERPRILSPTHLSKLVLEGFGERAREFADFLEAHPEHFKAIQYGFQFRKTGVNEQTLSSPLEVVVDRVQREVDNSGDPTSVIIQGVEEGWEVCLMKFAVELIQRSASKNFSDFRRRGLL